jgi:hypothetical protein
VVLAAHNLETCDHCGGRTKVIALVRDPDGIARFLRLRLAFLEFVAKARELHRSGR